MADRLKVNFPPYVETFTGHKVNMVGKIHPEKNIGCKIYCPIKFIFFCRLIKNKLQLGKHIDTGFLLCIPISSAIVDITLKESPC